MDTSKSMDCILMLRAFEQEVNGCFQFIHDNKRRGNGIGEITLK